MDRPRAGWLNASLLNECCGLHPAGHGHGVGGPARGG